MGPGRRGSRSSSLPHARGAYPHGVYWVSLAPLRDPALVLPEIAKTLGVIEERGRDLARTVIAVLAGKQRLLLLDNAEHLLPDIAHTVMQLREADGPTIIVTSRERLQLAGEQVYPVPPLDERESAELFTVRACALDPGFQTTPTVSELCARLDNLPLAIELAAARTSALSSEQVLERLSKRLDLLKAGRDADARQETLRATIEWSYALLSREEQELLAQLAVFTGGFTLGAAERICVAEILTLASLVDKSLVRRIGDRYSLLETIQEYAAERLHEAGLPRELEARHRQWYVGLAEEADHRSRSGDRELWFDRLEEDHGNLRAALTSGHEYGEVGEEVRLATALWRFWAERGYVSQGLRLLEDALERSSLTPVQALVGRCYLRTMTGSGFAEVLTEAEALAEACEREGDRFSHVQALNLVGMSTIALGRLAAAEGPLEQAISLAAGDYPAEEGEAVGWLLISGLWGSLPADQGIARCKEAYEHANGNRAVQAFALVERAPLEAMGGGFDLARKLLLEGRDIFRELDLKVFGVNTAQEGYVVEMLADDPAAAVANLRSAYDLLNEMGERSFLSTVAGYLAHASYANGDLRDAKTYSKLCAEAATDDDYTSQCLWRSVRAKLLACEGDFVRACRLAEEAVRLTGPTDTINAHADRLTDLAEALLMAGHSQEARGALVAALEQYERKGNLVSAGRTRDTLATFQV